MAETKIIIRQKCDRSLDKSKKGCIMTNVVSNIERRDTVSTRKEALDLLSKLNICRPRSFFGKIEEVQKGTGFILGYLMDAEETIVAGDLAKELNVSTARIAVLLNKLEKKGYVTRTASAEDARRTVVEITPAGRDLVNELREHILNKTMILIDQVGKQDLEEFLRISRKIKKALEDE